MLMFRFKTNGSTYPFNYSMLCWWNKWCYTFRPYPSVSKNTLPLFENVLWISLFKLDHQFTFKSEALSFFKSFMSLWWFYRRIILCNFGKDHPPTLPEKKENRCSTWQLSIKTNLKSVFIANDQLCNLLVKASCYYWKSLNRINRTMIEIVGFHYD